MQPGNKARLLTIYVDETDQHQHRPLHMVLLEHLRAHGFRGGTILRGVAGFGAHHQIHTTSLVDLWANLPIVIQVVDTADRIDAFLPTLDSLMPEGLATVQEVDVALYKRKGE